MHVEPVNGIRNCAPSKVAVPFSENGHAAPPGVVPVPLAVHVTVEPESVPLAVPVTTIVPKHFALNVPDPDVPEIVVMPQ